MLIPPEVLIAGAVVGTVAAVVGTVLFLDRKRRALLEEYALVRGFRFEPERPGEERRYEGVFELFTQGRSRKWGNTISGKRGDAAFTAFEYQWVTGSGKHSTTNRIGAIVWDLEDATLPSFSLAPEGWFSRLGEIFGMQDIDFPDAAEFSRTYRLKGTDEGAIRAYFTPDIRQFFAVTPDQQVAGGGRFLFWYRFGRLPDPDELDEWLEQGSHIRRRFLKK